MGRKKYNMGGKLHGRNMLITVYLWITYCVSLAPGTKPDESMKRSRKQVSSHIQVLKNFFKHHRCCEYFRYCGHTRGKFSTPGTDGRYRSLLLRPQGR